MIPRVLLVPVLLSTLLPFSPTIAPSSASEREPVIDHLPASPDTAERWRAVVDLGWDATPENVDALIAALGDTSPHVREAAARGLGWIGDRKAVPTLIAVLADADKDTAYAAAEALGRIGDPEAAKPLFERMRSNQGGSEGLCKLGKPAVELISTMLEDKNPYTRARAAGLLGETRHTDAIPLLIGATKDPDSEVRRRAATALHWFSDPRAFEAIAALASGDKDPEVRSSAVLEMSPSTPEGIQALIRALGGGESSQYFAVAQLSRLGKPALGPLVEALSDKNASVRIGAVRALGEMRDPAAAKPIEEYARQHSDEGQIEAVSNALVSCGEAGMTSLLSLLASPKHRWMVIDKFE